jgi:ankyrin repeat protein
MIYKLLPTQLIEAIGWSLLHSLWQGTLLAMVLALLLILLRTFSSQTRYLIIILFMGLFVATLPTNLYHLYKPTTNLAEGVTENTATSLGSGQFSSASKESAGSDKINKGRVGATTMAHLSQQFTAYFDRHLPLLVTGWLMGIVLLLLRFLGQLIYLQRLKHYSALPFPAQWNPMLERIEQLMKISRPVRYLESLSFTTPLTIGWLKPVVLFPVGLLTKLSSMEIEVILLHELAHIKRHDYPIHILQSLANILLFYHPVTYWMSNLANQEREHCCDEMVVALTGERESYATTLIHLQEQNLQHMKTTLSISGTRSSFSGRIMRVLNHSFASANRFREGFATAFMLIAGLSLLMAAGMKTVPKPSSKILVVQTSLNKADTEKVDLLIKAIDEEDEKLFNYLLKQGVDVNGSSSEGWTPLGYAAAEGRLTYVKLLLEKGAKVNLSVDDRHTPLQAAAAEGHLEVVKLLLEQGAALDAQIDKQTALSLAAREGHMEIVRFLLPKSPKLTQQQKVDLLLSAIDENQEELFEYWISQGADINGIGEGGWTPLGFASQEGRLTFVKSLIAKGAKINYPSGDDRMPYLAAAGEGKLAVVEVLLEAGWEVDQSSANGTTALSMAAREGHGKVVDHLLSKGANVNKANSEGWTALHFATAEGHAQLMKKLIAAGAKLELPISSEWTNISMREGRRVIMSGWTPLMLAIEEEKLEATQVLLDAGANINVGVDKTVYALEGDWEEQKATRGKLLYVASGWTPLMEAVEKQNLPLVKLLLSRGADKNAVTKQGMSVKSIAQEKGNKEIMGLVQ